MMMDNFNRLGKAKRFLDWATLASLTGVLIFPALFSPHLLMASVALLIVCIPFQVYSVLRFTHLIQMSAGGKAFYSLGMFLPGISFLLLLVLREKAQKVLRKGTTEDASKKEEPEQYTSTEETAHARTVHMNDDAQTEAAEKDEKPSQRLPIGCSVASFVVLALVLGPVVGFMIHLRTVFYTNEAERAAFADMSKLGAAIERLRNEQVYMKCSERKKLTPETLQYLVGPYYGWAGTNQKYNVLIRIMGKEIWGCSPHGRRYENDQRTIYRILIDTGTELATQQGKCTGKSYGGPKATCFLSTAISPDCRIMRPKESKPCKEITPSD